MKGTDVFCTDKIRPGIFFSSRHTMAVYNIAPVLPGHSMIVPKRHVARIDDLTRAEVRDLSKTFRVVLRVLLRVYGDRSESYNLAVQIGRYGGGSVCDHMHIHIIPRRRDDKYTLRKKQPTTKGGRRISVAAQEREVARLRSAFKAGSTRARRTRV